MPDDDNKSSENSQNNKTDKTDKVDEANDSAEACVEDDRSAKEVGGRDGPDPTRYGDWEKNGRCVDF